MTVVQTPIQITNQKNHLFWLDFLRGIAIILVLFHHSTRIPFFDVNFHPVFNFLYEIGWMGVDLFFVISGCLISGLIFRQIQEENRIHFIRFYLRRSFRIFPVYISLVAFIFLTSRVHNYPKQLISSSWYFLQNYHYYEIMYFWTSSRLFWFHTWSLCVEEHFYLLFPFIAVLLQKTKQIFKFPIVVILLFTLSLGFRIYHFNPMVTDHFPHLFWTHCRMDTISIGCLISYTYIFYPQIAAKPGSRGCRA